MDGAISNVRVAFESSRDAEAGDAFTVGALSDGARLGFFLAQDGADDLADAIAGGDSFAFVDEGAPANALDTCLPTLTADGDAFDDLIVHHSAAGLNIGGVEQMLSGATTDQGGRLFIGVENLASNQTNELDFKDMVFSVDKAIDIV